MTPNLSRAQGPGRVAIALFAFNAVLPLISRLLYAVGISLGRAYTPLQGLTTFVGVIFFLIWLHRVTKAIREAQGDSRFTPGMAVGGWFIPLAQIVLPFLSMQDVWKRTVKQNGWVVPLWWTSYLLTIVINATGGRLPFSFPGIGYIYTAIVVTAFGSWAFMLFTVGEKSAQNQTASSVLTASMR
jgi:hypothetical protein